MAIPRSLRRIVAVALSASLLTAGLIVPASADERRARIDSDVSEAAHRTSGLVHASAGASLDAAIADARSAGLDVGTRYDAIDVFVAYGSAEQFRSLAESASVRYIEANAQLIDLTDTSHQATRGENVLAGEVTGPDGTILDGAGVGVAVVDSGVDGTHPDLAPRMGGNVKMVCSAPMFAASAATPFEECRGPKVAVAMDDTDTASAGGHGTHVAGIIAGTGAASDGRFHGAAPGGTLYGVSSGTFLTVESALDGLTWVLENHYRVSPPIKVVNNSWGSLYQDYDPQNGVFHKATWKLQEALVKEGVTVVFAAGNSFGTGFRPTTTAECINPTPGIICVANYSDHNEGTREGDINGSSSRGEWDRPETWLDVAAPGTAITAACTSHLPVCMMLDESGGAKENYATLTGTSMAAPNVAGIVAQILQANPSLAPPEVENLLEDTAHKFAWGSEYGLFVDEGNFDNSSSFEKGHGLVDVVAAARVALGLDQPPGPSQFPGEPQPTIHEDEGIVLHWSFFSLTQSEFTSTCLYPPQSQAIDAYVFEIPEPLRARELRMRLGATNPIPFYDLDVTFYDAACRSLGRITESGEPVGAVPANTRYMLVTPGIFAYITQIFLELYDAAAPQQLATSLSLAVQGNGSAKTLVATLTDETGAPVAERAIDFFADGSAIGSAVTDASGVASLGVPPKNRRSKTTYSASFAGDESYSGSSSGP